MGHFLVGIGIIILVICFFVVLSLFSNNINNVLGFFLFFAIIGGIIGIVIAKRD